MKEYTVKQVSEMLETNPETVRRWIRAGKLEANQSSKKSGNIITEDALKLFLDESPKYAAIAAASLPAGLGLPIALGVLVANLLVSFKKKNVTPNDVENHIKKELQKTENVLREKNARVKALQEEIHEEEERASRYRYALNNLDFSEIATSINNERSRQTKR